MSVPESTKPNHKITVNLDGKDKQVLMSFGLLNVLMTYVQNPMDVLGLPLDAELTQTLISECLAERNHEGVLTSYPNLFTLDPDDGERIVIWVVDHLSYFFVQTLSQQPERLKALATALTSQTFGQIG